MKKNIRNLTEKEFDLVVVGGGIFGACAAWDATQRGLKVALLEKGDFSHATSAHHLKMVHGGIRYMQHGDVIRVWESSRERAALLKVAPHLVHPLPVVMPTYGHGKKGKTVLRTGVFLYDLLTLNRNRRIPDKGRQIPRGRMITRQEVLKHFPGVDQRGLTGGAVFYDSQMYSPPRLALSFIRSAANAGAEVANYIEVTQFLKRENRVEGIRATNVLTGERLEVRSKMVLNTAGPWASKLLESGMGLHLEQKPVFSRDVCFVVSRPPSGEFALACQIKTGDADAIFSRGGRHLFVAPWRDCTLVGVWHGVFEGAPEEVTVTREEMKTFLDEANEAYPGLLLSIDDIVVVNTGLILFAENRKASPDISFGKRSILIDHDRDHKVKGLITLIGVRATTARGMAEKAVALVFRKMGRRPPRSRTETTPIFGGEIDHFDDYLEQARERRPYGLGNEVLESLIHNYGCEYMRVLKYIDERPDLGRPVANTMVLKAEIVHAIREEMAEKLGDVIYRRTDLGTGRHPGEDAFLECARLMASELGWDGGREKKEADEARKHFIRHGIVTRGQPGCVPQ
ncbi:MAG: glycerol-3-phosphate dehydrogenase/oxidase [Deltaproteobacteria bacterium]|nr:glycerol-3-phosphate dehydrogenase/oxidase [Deltaproteobacteria bacterium]